MSIGWGKKEGHLQTCAGDARAGRSCETCVCPGSPRGLSRGRLGLLVFFQGWTWAPLSLKSVLPGTQREEGGCLLDFLDLAPRHSSNKERILVA